MSTNWEIASASVTGTEHIGVGGSFLFGANQDAYGSITLPNGDIVAIVCDGSSSGQKSEIGASQGVEIILRSLENSLINGFSGDVKAFEAILSSLKLEIMSSLEIISKKMKKRDETLEEVLRKYFLFSILGVYIGKKNTFIFAIGDGAYYINGSTYQIGPYPGNAPPYIAYNLISGIREKFQEDLDFQIYHNQATSTVQDVAIGTDGCLKLSDEEVWSFIRDDKYYSNEALLNRKLRQINQPVLDVIVTPKPNGNGWEITKTIKSGPLTDDATLIMFRKEVVKVPLRLVPSNTTKKTVGAAPEIIFGNLFGFNTAAKDKKRSP